MQLISLLKRQEKLVWRGIWLLSLVPALLLLLRFYTHGLGINPLQTLEKTSGNLALLFLIFTLAVTPARHYLTLICIKLRCKDGKRLADWNWLIRSRRMIGLYCFLYAVIHFSIYLFLDLALDWQWFFADLQEKPYIISGLISFILLIPLALTSTNKMMKLLGRNWRRLHKLIYLIAISAIIHYWWLTKVGIYDPWFYSLLIFMLLAYRILVKIKLINPNPADNGMVAQEQVVLTKSIEKRNKDKSK